MNQLFDTKPSCKTLNEKIPISSQATEANSIIVDSHSVNSDGQIRNESSAGKFPFTFFGATGLDTVTTFIPWDNG
jgi:hypothetical protein